MDPFSVYTSVEEPAEEPERSTKLCFAAPPLLTRSNVRLLKIRHGRRHGIEDTQLRRLRFPEPPLQWRQLPCKIAELHGQTRCDGVLRRQGLCLKESLDFLTAQKPHSNRSASGALPERGDEPLHPGSRYARTGESRSTQDQ